MCNPLKDPTCLVGGASAIPGVTNPFDWSDQLATKAMQNVADAVRLVTTGWTRIPSGALLSGDGAISGLRYYTSWFVGVLAVGALIFAGARIVYEGKGQEALNLVRRMGVLVLSSAASLTALQLLASAGDAYSNWILDQAATPYFGASAAALGTALITSLQGLGAIVEIFLAFALIAALISQLLMMLARVGVLALLAGLLPVAAAAALSRTGEQMLKRYGAWMVAFMLYKPVAATIFATAYWLMQPSLGDPKRNAWSLLVGLALMGAAVFALPALLRLVQPVVGAAVDASHGGSGVALAAAGGAVASGAMEIGGQLRSMSGSGGSGGGEAPAGARMTGGPAQTGAAQTGAAQTGAARAGAAQTGAAQTAATTGAAQGATGEPVSTAAMAAVNAGKGIADGMKNSTARAATGAAGEGQ